MDSPTSIITLLSAMDTAGAEHMKVLDHSNSDIIAGARSSETTSYFAVVFSDRLRVRLSYLLDFTLSFINSANVILKFHRKKARKYLH